MYSKSYADRVSGAVFLIGLGLLFTSLGGIVGGFFPGILFVIGASAFARGMAEGQQWYSVSGAMWMVGIGLVFLLGFNLPLLLILIGLTMLFGFSFRSGTFSDRLKHDNLGDSRSEKAKHDSYV